MDAIVSGSTQLASRLEKHFGVSRQTAHNYISDLVDDGTIVRTGPGQYELVEIHQSFTRETKGLEEHLVWTNDIAPILIDRVPDNVLRICEYGATEMINNAIDHSGSAYVLISVDNSAAQTVLTVSDVGVGIFRKIAAELDLEDDRHAVLELAKGKVTTDPDRHTGEGIFFSSRAFDEFRIFSRGVYFSHRQDTASDWILGEEEPTDTSSGTAVYMTMRTDSSTNLPEVFAAYTGEDGSFGFDKTVVPVELVAIGNDRLVSRSQARRLLSRFDRFRTVVLDFEGVPTIGQAFADEVFRVFPAAHPDVELVPLNANEDVSRMIMRST